MNEKNIWIQDENWCMNYHQKAIRRFHPNVNRLNNGTLLTRHKKIIQPAKKYFHWMSTLSCELSEKKIEQFLVPFIFVCCTESWKKRVKL